MVSQSRPKKAKLDERKFVLRLPDYQAAFLDHLVELGMFKSLNESIVKIITVFITDLENSAKEAKK
jgi:Arc/MetJ-type ribon-helix-helix transcriptional regulator